MQEVVVAGGSGLVGRRLLQRLSEDGRETVLLSRRPRLAGLPEGVRVAPWEDLPTLLPGAYALVNLAGEGIAGERWTSSRMQALRSSRVDTTARLVEAIARAAPPPTVLVSASAVGIYGSRGAEPVDEDSVPGSGFLPDLCREWEARADGASAPGTRVVKLRIGVVLAKEGGALPRMAAPVRWFLGAPLGSGRQGLSWIHIEDLVEMILQSLGDPTWTGAMNATSPEPLSNASFTRILGKVLGRPVLPVPGWLTATAVKAIAGRAGEELLLSGVYVLPKRALERGFAFRFPTAEGALRNLLS